MERRSNNTGVGGRNYPNFRERNFGQQQTKPSNFEKPAGRGTSSIKCFLCSGPHRVAECPQRAALNAIRALQQEETKESPQEKEEGEPAMMGALRFLNALERQTEQPKAKRTKGLMYVDFTVKGKLIRTLVDSGATHNFMTDNVAARLGLKVEKDTGKMKTVNVQAKETVGVAREVPCKLGSWSGNVVFTVAPMDDFDVVLGLDFLDQTRTIPVAATNCLLMMGESPCVIPVTVSPICERKILSAMQFKKGIKKGEKTYVAIPLGVEDQQDKEIPKQLEAVLIMRM